MDKKTLGRLKIKTIDAAEVKGGGILRIGKTQKNIISAILMGRDYKIPKPKKNYGYRFFHGGSTYVRKDTMARRFVHSAFERAKRDAMPPRRPKRKLPPNSRKKKRFALWRIRRELEQKFDAIGISIPEHQLDVMSMVEWTKRLEEIAA